MSLPPGNIYLVGMMGAGKSTVGKVLARKLNRQFIDSDREIVTRTGVPISTIFEIEGEAGFRKREAGILAEISQRDDAIVATGGGAVLSEENRALMKQSGIVVYLRAAAERLFERTKRDHSRPLLAAGDRRMTLAALLSAREPLYELTAHVIVESGTPNADVLAARIIEAIGRQGHSDAKAK